MHKARPPKRTVEGLMQAWSALDRDALFGGNTWDQVRKDPRFADLEDHKLALEERGRLLRAVQDPALQRHLAEWIVKPETQRFLHEYQLGELVRSTVTPVEAAIRIIDRVMGAEMDVAARMDGGAVLPPGDPKIVGKEDRLQLLADLFGATKREIKGYAEDIHQAILHDGALVAATTEGLAQPRPPPGEPWDLEHSERGRRNVVTNLVDEDPAFRDGDHVHASTKAQLATALAYAKVSGEAKSMKLTASDGLRREARDVWARREPQAPERPQYDKRENESEGHAATRAAFDALESVKGGDEDASHVA